MHLGRSAQAPRARRAITTTGDAPTRAGPMGTARRARGRRSAAAGVVERSSACWPLATAAAARRQGRVPRIGYVPPTRARNRRRSSSVQRCPPAATAACPRRTGAGFAPPDLDHARLPGLPPAVRQRWATALTRARQSRCSKLRGLFHIGSAGSSTATVHTYNPAARCRYLITLPPDLAGSSATITANVVALDIAPGDVLAFYDSTSVMVRTSCITQIVDSCHMRDWSDAINT